MPFGNLLGSATILPFSSLSSRCHLMIINSLFSVQFSRKPIIKQKPCANSINNTSASGFDYNFIAIKFLFVEQVLCHTWPIQRCQHDMEYSHLHLSSIVRVVYPSPASPREIRASACSKRFFSAPSNCNVFLIIRLKCHLSDHLLLRVVGEECVPGRPAHGRGRVQTVRETRKKQRLKE